MNFDILLHPSLAENFKNLENLFIIVCKFHEISSLSVSALTLR